MREPLLVREPSVLHDAAVEALSERLVVDDVAVEGRFRHHGVVGIFQDFEELLPFVEVRSLEGALLALIAWWWWRWGWGRRTSRASADAAEKVIGVVVSASGATWATWATWPAWAAWAASSAEAPWTSGVPGVSRISGVPGVTRVSGVS